MFPIDLSVSCDFKLWWSSAIPWTESATARSLAVVEEFKGGIECVQVSFFDTL